MDSRLLTTKPEAKSQKEVVINIKVTDDTSTTTFDRDAFLKSFETTTPANETVVPNETVESDSPPDEDEIIDKTMAELGKQEMKKMTFRQFFVLLKEKGITETYIDDNRANIKKKLREELKKPDEPPPKKKTDKKKQKSDAPPDAGPEAPPDAGPEAPPDAGPEAPSDVGPDAPQEVQKEPPQWYMNDRSKFIEFINEHFKSFKDDIDKEDPVMCSTLLSKQDFLLLSHQNIVKDYLNLYSPYRGLLLYHGLGSGKTCSSIAIAEGLKNKLVVVLTPASLEKNYMQELKKCGDPLYKFNKNWVKETYSRDLARENSLPKQFAALAAKQGGIWMENSSSKISNYETLSAKDKEQIEAQIDVLIREKYTFLHYNGTLKISKGMFDDKVVIVDEAHDLVLSISNQLGSKPDHKTLRLYDELMSAKNCRVVLLSGTPIVNFPNEIAVMFNIIRGFIKTWTVTLEIDTDTTINLDYLTDLFLTDKDVGGTIDYINYEASSKLLTITRNPEGFKNVSNRKVTYDESDMTDEDFIVHVKKALQSIKGIKITEPKMSKFKALPDKKEDFDKMFMNDQTGDLEEKEIPKFKRRILGLTSFFPDLTRLMPKYDGNMKIEGRPMSDYQMIEYQKIRKEEIATEKTRAQNKQRFGEEESSSTYRNASRQACNFVFPEEIERPKPDKQKGDKRDQPDEDENDQEEDVIYDAKKKKALSDLFQGDYLTAKVLGQYSPKFLSIYQNITTQQGLHLVYSHYREMEGIAILKLVLLKNKFQEFKLKKNRSGEWSVDDSVKPNVPCFVSYGGQKDKEEKEILRNIYNSDWSNLPPSITKFFKGHANNHYGEVIKVFMITASGSQGISLKNVQFVHLTEPFWHLVRLEQVIGRARRICSHESLPLDKQKINVYLYVMMFDPKKKLDVSIKDHDISKKDKKSIFTTDESIYETALIKETIKNKFLKMIKETAIDCTIHSEDLHCFSIPNPSPNKYSYVPDVTEEDSTSTKEVKIKYLPIKIPFGDFKGKPNLIMNPKIMKDANGDDYTNVYELNKTNNTTTLVARLYKNKKKTDGTSGVVVETV